MENAADPATFYKDLIAHVDERPGAMQKVVFELQTVDWRKDSAPLPISEIAGTIRSLYDQGVEHVAYYPDMLFQNHPDPAAIRAALAVKPDMPEVRE
jgi:biofilm PGA synthesis lipoprotein PgaB